MCLEPVKIDDQKVACRYCRRCRDNRLNDLVGRCVAEQSTASATVSVTLTYAGDVPEAASLNYRDVQNLLKRLRKAGYSVRYICAGEYGTRKGRAHWHIVLFFYGQSPNVSLDQRIDWEFWPHGFSYFQQPDYKGFRYVMKYALKDQVSQGKAKALSMSKKPPLGYDFFMKLASDLVDRHLPVHSPQYSFADVLDNRGVPRKYWLQGRMREIFLERYCDLWRARHRSEPPYTDYLLERYLDPIAREELETDRINRWLADVDKPMSTAFLMLPHPYYGIVTAYSDRTADIVLKDGSEWQVIAKENGGLSVKPDPFPKLRPLWPSVRLWLMQNLHPSHGQSPSRLK